MVIWEVNDGVVEAKAEAEWVDANAEVVEANAEVAVLERDLDISESVKNDRSEGWT